MTRLHIGLIIDGLAGGGAERVVITLAGAFAQRGHRVTLVSLRDEQAYPIPDGVEYVLVADHYRGPLRRQTEIWRRARQLNHVLLQKFGARPFDLALSNLPKTDRIVAATPCLAQAWFCLHGAVAQTQLARKNGLKRWLKRRQLAHTYDHRKLIVVSPGLKDDIVTLGGTHPKEIQVISNPFDFDQIHKLAATSCPLDGENFLLHIGRFHPQKRHDRLFAGFKLSQFPGKLVLLGTGSVAQQQTVQQLAAHLGIAERVVMLGFTENPYPYLRAARALVLSSDSEGFGNVLVEAMACGTVAISTRSAGPESILTGELERGLCAPNEHALAETIQTVLANPPTVTPEALIPFSLNNIADRYLALAELPTMVETHA